MTREFFRVPLIFLLLRLCLVTGKMDFYELNNAQYEFNIDAKPVVFDEIPDDNDTLITVANKKGQRFVCTLPERPSPKEKDLMEGSSVNPKIAAEQLAKHLLKCIKLNNGWWTYTLCPRKSISQSHGRADDTDFVSLSLGIFTGHYSMPTKMSASEGEDKMLYLEEKYDMGEVCDITGAPRTTVVHYSCDPRYGSKDAAIYSVDEEASCEYKVDVRTGALCSISQFQPPKPPTTQPIQCAPVISAAAAARMKKGEEIRKKNKAKAKRELEAIKSEYDEVKIRRWSIERRRMEVRTEEFDLKMRDLDEDYIDMTRDQLEWSIIAKTGEEPPADTKETIHELLDNMEAIETAQVIYDSVADEDRANLWYYFHNKRWRQDGFPLLLDEVDARNGFVMYLEEVLQMQQRTQLQTERIKRLMEFGHPSRLDAAIAYAGVTPFQVSLTMSLTNVLGRLLPPTPAAAAAAAERSAGSSSIPTPSPSLSPDAVMRMSEVELERRLREAHRHSHSSRRPSTQDLIDVFALVWALRKVDEVDPLRDDAAWREEGRKGMESVVLAETIDRLLSAWKFFDSLRLAEEEKLDKLAGAKDLERKFGAHRTDIDRVEKAGGEWMNYYELLERTRDAEERRKTMEGLGERVETTGTAALSFVTRVQFESNRPALIIKARRRLPPTTAAAKLANDLGHDAALAVFRDSVDAMAVMERLQDVGLGSDTVKLQIHVKDGQVLSAEDDSLIKQLIDRELKDARTREKTRLRQKAYDYEVKDDEYHLL